MSRRSRLGCIKHISAYSKKFAKPIRNVAYVRSVGGLTFSNVEAVGPLIKRGTNDDRVPTLLINTSEDA